MADPEIELPRTASQLRFGSRAPGISDSTTAPEERRSQLAGPASPSASTVSQDRFQDKFQEKSDQDEPSEDERQPPDHLVYHYLTFSTELPHPTTICPSREGQPAPPPPPELKHFASPFDWPERRKNVTIWVACIITALTAFTAGAYSPGIPQMSEEWKVSNVAALVGITTFTTGGCFLSPAPSD